MKLTDEDKKQILEGFIKIFIRISNEEYQKKIWIRGEGPECHDFTDTLCDFTVQGEPILKNYKDFNITDVQYQLLINFRDTFEAFSDENDLPQKFIASPEKKIMEMAKEV